MVLKGTSNNRKLMYGVNMSKIYTKMGCNVSKATLNMFLKFGKLGKVQNLTLELNHLNF